MSSPYRVYCLELPSHDILNCLSVSEDYRQKKDQRTGFYSNLEKSVLADGFRNPLLINAGYVPPVNERFLPPEWRVDRSLILACVKLGGSRLWVAQQHGLTVPCVVSDFCGRFADQGHRELLTPEDVMAVHQDPPRWVSFAREGIMTSQLIHTHMT